MFLCLPLSGPEIVYEEFFKGLNITPDQMKFFTYYEAATELLQAEHTSLRQMEHENARILNAKGELSDDSASSYAKLQKFYDLLYHNVTALTEALDILEVAMPEDGHTTRVTSGGDTSSPAVGKDSSALEAIWDDEVTRAFYECLPDLRAFLFQLCYLEKRSQKSMSNMQRPKSNQLNLRPNQTKSTGYRRSCRIFFGSWCFTGRKNQRERKGKGRERQDQSGGERKR